MRKYYQLSVSLALIISCVGCISPQTTETKTSSPTATSVPPTATPLPELTPKETILGNGFLIKIVADNNQDRVAVLSSTGIRIYNPDNTFVEYPISNAMDMDWAPESDKIAIGTRYGEIIIWDLTTETTNQFLNSSDRRINAIKWSNDGTKLAVGNSAGVTTVWEVDSAKHLAQLGNESMIMETSIIEWSSNDRSLFLAYELVRGALINPPPRYHVNIWETEKWSQINVINGDYYRITELDWSPIQEMLAIAHDDGTVTFWSETKEHDDLVINTNSISLSSIAWTQDGEIIAVGGNHGEIELWAIQNNTLIAEIDAHVGLIRSVDWLGPDSRIVSAGLYDGHVKFWRLDDLQLDNDIDGYYVWDSNVVWSHLGNYIAVAKSGGDILFWNRNHRSLEFSLSTNWEWVNKISISPNEKYMVAYGDYAGDSWFQIWDLYQKEIIYKFQAAGDEITSVDWSADSASFILATQSGNISVWAISTNKILEVEFELPDLEIVSQIAWALQDEFVVIGSSDGVVQMFNLASEEVTYSDFCSEGYISSMDVSPDGKILLAVCRDGSVKAWDIVNSFELLFDFQGENVDSVSWSSDGEYFVIAGPYFRVYSSEGENSYFGIWDKNFNQVTEYFTGEEGFGLLSVSWSPDSSQLVTLGRDHVITIWTFSK